LLIKPQCDKIKNRRFLRIPCENEPATSRRRQIMFQKKQYIYSGTLGVCLVENITQLSAGKEGQVAYYVLRPIFAKEEVSYIPVENHQMELRELFTEEEARRIEQDPSIDLSKDEKLKAAVDFVLHDRRK
jgi:hypothetical protein